MKNFKLLFIFAILLSAIISCQQDPIFYYISKEEPPVDPTIAGAISKMEKTPTRTNGDYEIYACNGKLWRFHKDSSSSTWYWENISTEGTNGKVLDVAVTDDETVYILCLDNISSAVYKRTGSTSAWIAIGNNAAYDMTQSIYAAGNKLFAGARKTGSDRCTVLELSGDTLVDLYSGAAANTFRDLTGAVFDGSVYYFSATNGIFKYNGSGTPVVLTNKYIVTGIFRYNNDNIIAVTDTAEVLKVNKDGAPTPYSKSYPANRFTGAIALWESNTSSAKRLLLGVRGGVDYYGYYEMKIEGGAPAYSSTLSEPGSLKPDSSVDDQDSYRQQLKKYAVTYLMQAPKNAGLTSVGKLPVVFAGTQKNGVWSYRESANKAAGVWNAE